MATSCELVQIEYQGNGTSNLFSFPFPYELKTEVRVALWDNTDKKFTDLPRDDATYPWEVSDANPTSVTFTSTPPPSPPTPGINEDPIFNIRIYRMTDLTDIRAIFNQGSAIRASDLNRNFEQIQFALQEGRCQLSELVLGYLQDYYWNKFDTTAYSSDTWPVNDQNLATTSAIDSRIDFKIDEALTNDIAAAAGSGLTVTDDGDGTITLDFDQNITLSVSPTSGLTKTDNGDGTTTLGINSWGVYLNSLNFTDEASFKQSVNLEIGVDVQAYDPNTAKLDVAQTFTADQTFTGTQTYPKIPSNAQTVAYTLVASDAGKHINATNSVTVPSGVFGVGDAISIYNNSGSNQTIVQGATVTIRQSGTANTGNRTLAQYGLCTLLCVASNEFVIAGSGLS